MYNCYNIVSVILIDGAIDVDELSSYSDNTDALPAGAAATGTAGVGAAATDFETVGAPAQTVDVPVSAALLDPEALEALEAGTKNEAEYGLKIHNHLSRLWLPLLKKGLPSNDRERLNKKYLIPENCKLLQAPKLNFEISAAINECVLLRDNEKITAQQQLGVGVTAVNRALDALLTRDESYIINAIKYLGDACRLLCDLHHTETQIRIDQITPNLDESIFNVVQGSPRDETLFGINLSDKIKSAEKQILQQKTTTSTAPPVASTSQSQPMQSRIPCAAGSRCPLYKGGRAARQ